MRDGTDGKSRGLKVGALRPLQNNRCTFPIVPLQSNKPTSGSQLFSANQHIRSIRRMSVDVFCFFHNWPHMIICERCCHE